jgi:hypothetical protein
MRHVAIVNATQPIQQRTLLIALLQISSLEPLKYWDRHQIHSLLRTKRSIKLAVFSSRPTLKLVEERKSIQTRSYVNSQESPQTISVSLRAAEVSGTSEWFVERPVRANIPSFARTRGRCWNAKSEAWGTRLEGFDDDWLEMGTRRVAYYTNIPPGSYRFRVMTSNSDGVRNKTVATCSFRLTPRADDVADSIEW